jgi:hypothetical protein
MNIIVKNYNNDLSLISVRPSSNAGYVWQMFLRKGVYLPKVHKVPGAPKKPQEA